MKRLLSLLLVVIIITSLSSCYEYKTEIKKTPIHTNDFSKKITKSELEKKKLIIYRCNKLTGEIIKMDEDLNEIK